MKDAPAIGDYALIGDTRAAALVSLEGSIDWLCLPRFDSEPVFSRLIGGEMGGHFSVRPDELRSATRRYLDDSAVLETEWETETGTATLTEGMALELTGAFLPQAVLIRQVACTGGEITLRVVFNPLKGLPGRTPKSHNRNGSLICSWGSFAVVLQSSLGQDLAPGIPHIFTLRSGQELTLTMTLADRAPIIFVSPEAATHLLLTSAKSWKEWVSRSRYEGPRRDSVVRSLITLRLLTFSPSGAPVAAPTTSLPEVIGGGSNWDYRYSWPRDAALGVDAFLSLGMHEEAMGFIRWLLHADRLTRPEINVMYNVFGRPAPPEIEIEGLPGFRGSRPVRVGNGARDQFQLDVYGWVLDAAWRLEQAGHSLFSETWRALAASADFVCKNWEHPDNGIWEVREKREEFVHSKLMCLLAMERVLDLARGRRVKPERVDHWRRTRDLIRTAVISKGVDSRGAFVQAIGSREMDAAVLVPLIELSEVDGLSLKPTIEAIRAELGADGPLIHRYRPETKAGGDNPFLACSFWLIHALAVTGKADTAAELFEEMCSRSNEVGLFAEEMDSTTGEHLGNFPQALTHSSLIRAAVALKANQPERKNAPRITP